MPNESEECELVNTYDHSLDESANWKPKRGPSDLTQSRHLFCFAEEDTVDG